MSKRYFFFLAAFFAGALYLMVPGCGNKGSNSNAPVTVPPGTGTIICTPGQVNCVPTSPAGGIPLLNGPSVSTLDSRGTLMVLSYAAASVTPGGAYTGPVNIVGSITFAPNTCYSLPPGTPIPVQGQGYWEGNFAGSIARVRSTAPLQLPNGPAVLAPSLIKFGVDQNNPTPVQGYYLEGQISIPGCSPIPYIAL
jgi:hypothetical protein